MRIRKHAKISQLVDTAASYNLGPLLQTYVCQLNQSPWDAMSFSPPSSPPSPLVPEGSTETADLTIRVDGGDACGGDGGSDRRISVAESKNLPKIDANVHEFVGNATAEDREAAKERCCKTDGKSWRCRREAAAGSSLCEHHLSLVKNYQNLTHNSTNKSENSNAESRRSTRSKMESWSLDSHEFYYYSSFRPGWSKKRPGLTSNNPSSSRVPRKVDCEFEKSNNEELMMDSEETGEDVDEDEKCQDEGETATTAAAAGKKKRARKPVKARSLKSLM